MNGTKRLLFYSPVAFYKPLYSVFDILCTEYGLRGYVITYDRTPIYKVYSPSGYISPESAGLDQTPEFVSLIPYDSSPSAKLALFRRKLREIRPSYVWGHTEPVDWLVNRLLRWSYFRRDPLIAVHANENLFCDSGCLAPLRSFRRRILWRRYTHILACASKSMMSIRNFGMPKSVPITVAWLMTQSPPLATAERPSFLPRKNPGDVFVGFAGRITAAKGWHVLLAALTQLPPSFKCLIAGTGDQEALLRLWCSSPQFQDRVYFLGALPKDTLWNFYRALDLFVLPSLTTPSWTEQFGAVLAEAMACGVPVIGSDSGAIPEVIGDAGLVVEEQNPTALAEAIRKLGYNLDLRRSLGEKGICRFQKDFTCEAYARHLADAFGLCRVAECK
ncbi:MAG: glycosyltransferase family 4 protein [Terriglobia bacterium]|jgi:glycosyltransferase involved in cell wall biosynthesis